MIFTVSGCIKLDLSFERLNGVDATGLYKNRDNRCSAEMMTRCICISLLASLVGGCAPPYPRAWVGCPFEKQVVVDHDFRCADRDTEPRWGETP